MSLPLFWVKHQWAKSMQKCCINLYWYPSCLITKYLYINFTGFCICFRPDGKQNLRIFENKRTGTIRRVQPRRTQCIYYSNLHGWKPVYQQWYVKSSTHISSCECTYNYISYSHYWLVRYLNFGSVLSYHESIIS